MSGRTDFLASAAAAVGDDCIVWPFAIRRSSGYGAHNLATGRKNRKINVDAHVYACTLAHGPRPGGDHQAAHSCGNKLCCNGNHLRWATRAENMQDAKDHGTLKGGGRHRQRLSPRDVADIRASNASLIRLGERYSMDPAYMGKVRRGECHA